MNPRGKVTTFTCDGLNRLEKETFQEGIWVEHFFDAVRSNYHGRHLPLTVNGTQSGNRLQPVSSRPLNLHPTPVSEHCW